MSTASRDFQVFAKPAGALCNLGCRYCYYLERERLCPTGEPLRMPDDALEAYIVQHIEAWPDRVICFSWHGGEPTILGADYFRKIVTLQGRHLPAGATSSTASSAPVKERWDHRLAAEFDIDAL